MLRYKLLFLGIKKQTAFCIPFVVEFFDLGKMLSYHFVDLSFCMYSYVSGMFRVAHNDWNVVIPHAFHITALHATERIVLLCPLLSLFCKNAVVSTGHQSFGIRVVHMTKIARGCRIRASHRDFAFGNFTTDARDKLFGFVSSKGFA